MCCNRIAIKNAALDDAILKAVTEAPRLEVLDAAVDLAVEKLTSRVKDLQARKVTVKQELIGRGTAEARPLPGRSRGRFPRWPLG